MKKKYIFLLYCTLIYFNLGAYTVSASWAMLTITNNPGSIGCMLIVSSLCTLFAAPLLGVLVDRLGFRWMTLIGQFISLIVGLLPYIINHFYHHFYAIDLYCISFLFSISTILSLASFDRILKLSIPDNSLKKIRVLMGTYQQFALMIGTSASGFLISQYNVFNIFPIISIIATISLFVFFNLINNIHEPLNMHQRSNNLKVFFLDGIQHIFKDKHLLIAALSISIAYASAQVMNVNLPVFIKLEINGNSNLFGLCEMSWAAGGIMSTLMLSYLLTKFKLDWLPLFALFGLGFTMLLLGRLHYTSMILLTCMMIGILFNIARTLSDANLLTSCPSELIGRVRSNIIALTNLIGIIIYSIPIIAHAILPSTLYGVVGAMTMMLTFLLFIFYKNVKVKVQEYTAY